MHSRRVPPGVSHPVHVSCRVDGAVLGGVGDGGEAVLSVRMCVGCVIGKSSGAPSVVSSDVARSLVVSSQVGKSSVLAGGASEEMGAEVKVVDVVVMEGVVEKGVRRESTN